jgi:ribosome recycling factor
MGYDDVLLEADEKMEKAVDHLKGEYRGMRTGRANPGLVEGVRVDYYGSPTPLKQLANILAPEPNLLVIKPFDPGSLGDIEKAILKSDLGITPSNDGKVIRLAIPPLSQERRKQLVKRAEELAEQQRIAIRNVRRDANKQADEIVDSGELPEDDWKKLKDEIDDQTKKYVKAIDDVLAKKKAELMEV